MDKFEARAKIEHVCELFEQAAEDVESLYMARAWELLGYKDWNELCDKEWPFRVQFSRERRIEMELRLNDAGMPQKAIVPVVGVSKSTVSSDLASAGRARPRVQNRTDGHDLLHVMDSLGRRARKMKPTPDEIADRQAQVKELREQGLSFREIANQIGWERSTVRNDWVKIESGKVKPRPRPQYKIDNTPQPMRYRSEFIRVMKYVLNADRLLGMLAADIREATFAEDDVWLDETQALTDDVYRTINEALDMLRQAKRKSLTAVK